MTYVQSNPLSLESQYPYTSASGKTGTCDLSLIDGQVSVSQIHNVSANSASSLKAAIESGVVSVTVDAEQNGFMYYTGGVVSASQCSGTSLDHAIAAVGYGSENGQEYYIVRNSWGTSWGESGYIRIAT